MADAVEIALRQLHQGVSRQPDHIRFPGQVQEALNRLFRVEEGGHVKRFGSKYVQKIRDVLTDPTQRLPFHVINLSAAEKYGFTIYNGTPYVVNLIDGTLPTVTVDPASASYINQSNFLFLAFVSILDYTLICNKEIVPAMKATTTSAGSDAVIFHVANGREGVYSIEVDGSTASYTATSTGSTQSTTNIASNLATSIDALLGAAYTVTTVGGSYIIITKTSAISTATCSDPVGGQGIIKCLANDFLASSDELPAFAVDGMIVKIGAGTSVDGQPTPVFYMKFHASSGNSGYWDETIAPGIAYQIDPATMPQVMVRNGDGSFTISPGTWGDRVTGDTTTVPDPPFIGATIFDTVYFKDRLGLACGENWYFSRPGDYFNFWPSKSTLALDSDPFGRRASSNRPAVQSFGLPHAKVLWATSDENQFEMSTPDILTDKKAVFDPTTAEVASPYCRPEPMKDLLYFPSWTGPNALILEYTYDALSLRAKAPEITKHVRGYIPHPILGLTSNPPTGDMFMWSAANDVVTDKLWVWTEFTEGDQRQQSAFSQWQLPNAFIHAARVVTGTLYLLIGRSDGIFLEAIELTDGTPSDFPNYAPRLDRWIILTTDSGGGGTYDVVTDTTTYVVPYAVDGGTCIVPDGRKIDFTQSGGNVVVAGNVPKMIFGFEYPSYVQLSKVYYRDQQGVAILNGKLSLGEFTIAHKATGYYEVEFDQPARDAVTHVFTARVLGATTPPDYVGQQPIVDGIFHKPIGYAVQADTTTITIRNNSYLPDAISAVVFRGIFNETVRQG